MILRPLEMNDLPEVYDLIRAAAAADHTAYVTREALRRSAESELAVAKSAVAVIPDGQHHNTIAGFAWWDGLQHPSMPMEGWTHPLYRRKGVGTGLLVAARSAARQLGVENLTGRTFDTVPGAEALFQRRDFSKSRRFNQMWIDLGNSVEFPSIYATPPTTPEGFTVRAFREADTHALYEADTEAFSEHWGAQPQSLEAWRKRMLADFDPALWQLVWDGDQVAALCLAEASPFGGVRDGWVSHLAVRATYRGRGLGRFTLLRGLWNLGQAGFERVGLHVDSGNALAIRLYESAGMRKTRERIHLRKSSMLRLESRYNSRRLQAKSFNEELKS